MKGQLHLIETDLEELEMNPLLWMTEELLALHHLLASHAAFETYLRARDGGS